MGQVFAIRDLVLRPEIKPEAFETFITVNLPLQTAWPEMQWVVAKGDCGERTNRYAFFQIFASVAARNRYYPQEGLYSLEAYQRFAASADFIAEWDKYGTSGDDLIVYTDYEIIGQF